jgi:D-psicose/D-tagatose/L-ribulose 3-epimerase
VEPLNRYETDVLNSLADGADLCRGLGGRIALLADTYHQQIEEADPVAALRAHLSQVGHVHLSENHRGPVGTGHIPWSEVVGALDTGGYAGRAVVEGFNGRVAALARATCIWRPRAASPDDYAAASAAALRPFFR